MSEMFLAFGLMALIMIGMAVGVILDASPSQAPVAVPRV